MYSVRWPWASRSISSTLWPISASAAPRLTAVVVLPTPPFCIATAIVRVKSAPSLTEGGYYRPILTMARGSMFIDVAVAVLILLALFLGYQRGVIQPLMAEIFFFGTLLVIFRFHDQYTSEMQKLLHINAVLSV